MTQLEVKLKDDKYAHGKALEREQEQFKHQCERDSDKLRMKIRMELENRVSVLVCMWSALAGCAKDSTRLIRAPIVY